MVLNTEARREKLWEQISHTSKPLTGTALAREFSVSRQIIVGDIGVLRAMGHDIFATPRGYIVPQGNAPQGIVRAISCRHSPAEMQRELYTIVDNGGHVRDVVVEHPFYGEIRAGLFLSNRREVDAFLRKMAQSEAMPLCSVTDGVHIHTIAAPDEASLQQIEKELREAGILYEKD
jgi:transcriptional regulator of NAD metabolism